MKTYSAHLSYVYKTDKGLRESDSEHIFLAEDHKAALLAMQPLLKWAEKQYAQFYPGAFVGCIKLHEYFIAPPKADGSCNDTGLVQFFEWKHDWPGTLDDWVATKIEKEKRRIS